MVTDLALASVIYIRFIQFGWRTT
ncbi:hypothetical protein A2U01_0030994, partial [Trifolium medium]|nr:hypothetical protein [Trifolium medium]